MISIFNPISNSKLAKFLEKEGYCTRAQFREIELQTQREGRPLIVGLLDKANGGAEKILGVLGKFYNLEPVVLRGRVISLYVLNIIPKELAEAHNLVIFKKVGEIIFIATANPEDREVIDFIKRKTGLQPQLFVTTPADIAYALQRYEGTLSEEFSKIIEESLRDTLASHEPIEKLAQFVPVVKIVNSIIDRALAGGASDIHIEPTNERIVVRFRIDGLLKRVVELPGEVLPPILARLKLMANLKIDEHRVPQDGRFQYTFHDREVAVRVSVVPNLYGSKVALRLLDTKQKKFNLRTLGFNRRDLNIIKRQASKPHGLVLVTGPTGSGKTTTLYALLRLLNKERVNICTIEDPIEYGLEGINQMQINPSAGLTFASGLRALLRQDPDIVMVGEIRDPETAEIALNAAMTGHLVLSSLHTNNAFLAPQRLVEMGLQPFMVASVVNLIIGQRLVRTVCRYCSGVLSSPARYVERYATSLDLAAVLVNLQTAGLLDEGFTWEQAILSVGQGCDRCHHSGYQGRVGIYEFLEIEDNVRQSVLKSSTAAAVKLAARKQKAITMVEDGILKVINGQTTFEEVLRVTQE